MQELEQVPLHPPVQKPLSQLSAHVAVQEVLHSPEHEELQLLLQLEQVEDLELPLQVVLQLDEHPPLQLLEQLEQVEDLELPLQVDEHPYEQLPEQLVHVEDFELPVHDKLQDEPVQPFPPFPSALSRASNKSSSSLSHEINDGNIVAPINIGNVPFIARLKKALLLIISSFISIFFISMKIICMRGLRICKNFLNSNLNYIH